MIAKVQRQSLIDVINRVNGAVDRRATIPILSHVKMEVLLRGAITVAATDLEISAAAECSAEVPGPGCEMCVPATQVKNALAAINEAEVWIDLIESTLIISGGDIRYEFATLPVDEFPAGQSVEESALVTFDPRFLPRMITSVSHAAADSASTKHNLSIIHIHHIDNQLTAVATDGHRMSLCGIKDVPGAQNIVKPIELPLKTSSILSNVVGTIEFSVQEKGANLLHFSSPGSIISSRIPDVDYPDYRHVIQTDYPSMVTVERKKLLSALEACGVISDDKSKSVNLKALTQEQLNISALGTTGVVNVDIPCSGDDNIDITVPSKQLIQAVKSLEGDEVFFKYRDKTSPLQIYPSDYGVWDERMELIMAMRKDG